MTTEKPARRTRAVTLAFSFAVLSMATPVRAETFDPRDVDKQAHMATSYAMTLTGSTVLQRFGLRRVHSVLISVGATMVLATAKEWLLDDRFSVADEVANTIGVGAAVGVVFAFEL